MADSYLLENGVDRYLLEDGTGVYLLEGGGVVDDLSIKYLFPTEGIFKVSGG